MFVFKGCPRCGGDLRRQRELDGEEEYRCLQCGRRLPAVVVDLQRVRPQVQNPRPQAPTR